MIPVLNPQQEQLVRQRTADLIQQAAGFFQYAFADIDILFDLKGRNLGMYVKHQQQFYIRYNAYVFARHFDDCLQQTTAHEVAHYVCDQLYGLASIRPHGKEWQAVMQMFGVPAKTTSNLDISGLPMRQYRQFNYQCACQQHQLSSIRHYKVERGQATYHCRQCGQRLALVSQ